MNFKKESFNKKIICGIILILITTSLLLTGFNNFLSKNKIDYIAKVNGVKIRREQLEQAFAREHERQNKILGKEFAAFINNENYITQLYQQVLSQMIDNILLEQYVKKLHLTVSDKKIREIIFDQSMFKTNGKFENKKYLDVLNEIHITPEQYVTTLKQQLPTQQFITTIVNTNFFLENELNYLLNLFTEKRIVRTMMLNVKNNFMQQNVLEEEMQEFYKKNKSNFFEPEMFQIHYIPLDSSRINSIPIVYPEEIKNWYNENKFSFIQKQKDLYSIIQVSTESEANKILNKIKNGAHFKKIAKEKALIVHASKYKNGTIGWIEHSDAMPEELKKANLTKKGQISNIIKSSNGFLIIRLDDVKPSHILSLDKVKDIVIKKIKDNKNTEYYHQLKLKINDELSNNASIEKIKKISNLDIVKTVWFDRYHLPLELNYKPIENFIFNQAKKDNLKLITIDEKKSFLIHVFNHKAKREQTFLEAKKQIFNIIKYNKAVQTTKIQAKKIIDTLKSTTLHDIQKLSLHFSTEKIFSRNTEDSITSIVFSMPKPKEKKSSYSIFEDYQGHILILSLDKIFNSKISKQQKELFLDDLIQKDTQAIFNSILIKLRKAAKIQYGLNKDIKS